MSITPAKIHFDKTLARDESGKSPVQKGMNLYDRMLMQLAEHKRRLKAIQSIEKKSRSSVNCCPSTEPTSTESSSLMPVARMTCS